MSRFNVELPRAAEQLRDQDFRVHAQVTDDGVEILMHGIIGDQFTQLDSMSVAGFLSQHRDKQVLLRVNSPGGLAYDGIAIANALAMHPSKTVALVEGIAASAAAIAIQGTDERRMFSSAQLMVHRAWTVVIGNAAWLRDAADMLDKLDDQLIRQLASRSGKTVDRMRKLMDGNMDGTYLSAEEAIAEGLADTIVPGKKKDKSGGEKAYAEQLVRQAAMAKYLQIRERVRSLD